MTARLPMLFLVAALSAGGSASAAGLVDAYGDALRSDPTLREAAAVRMATLEARPQALAALLPQLSANGEWSTSWNSGSNTFSQAVTDGNDQTIVNVRSGFSSTTNERQAWQLELTQSLFRWDQWVALRQSDKQLAQAEAEFRAAEQNLMVRVSQRYFDALAANATLMAAEAANPRSRQDRSQGPGWLAAQHGQPMVD